jgi:hypothetical protein
VERKAVKGKLDISMAGQPRTSSRCGSKGADGRQMASAVARGKT